MSSHDQPPIESASGPDELPDLPRDLRELDRELLSMEISERESFGPELEAELGEAWKARPRRATSPARRRMAIAASLSALLLVSLGVPPARAGLVRFLVAVQEGATDVLNLPVALEEPGVEVQPPPAEVLADRPSDPKPPPAPSLDDPGSPETARAASFTVPALADRERAQELIRSFYPEALQEEGVGGNARLLLWVDTRGRVAEARLESSSGVAELDRAALAAAPALRFRPATRAGRPAGTWLEFDVRFSAVPVGAPAVVASLEAPDAGQVGRTLEIRPEWMPSSSYVAPAPRGAREMLREALDGESEDWTKIEDLLAGGPPTGSVPLRWREEASDVLQDAILRNPSNPAPFLALARIRRNQGLRIDARRLYDRGIDRVLESGSSIPPRVTADLHYERASMIREEWLPWRNLGEIPSAALQNTPCARAPSLPSSRRYASGEDLVAWNFRCPGSFDHLMDTRFEPLAPLKEEDREEMLVSLYEAVEADPGHVEANTELLLSMADEGRWSEMLENAQYFLAGSNGHPYAQLLIGMALHRLGRSQDASVRFHQALAQLPPAQVDQLVDVTPLLEPEAAERYARLEGPAKERATRAFWEPLDPLLTTVVNEREVEHLARAAYALLRFGTPDSDAGRVWIRYGAPDRTFAVGDGSDQRTEFWDYGPGPDLTFRRPSTSDRLKVTSETRTYLENLRGVFPHRYAPSASEVLPLVGQRARFRDEDGSGMELEIHTRVPEDLVHPLADSLDLGVFLLSSEGERWIVDRRHIPAAPEPLHLRVPIQPNANRAVVEIYDPVTGRAAALRTPVSAEELTAGDETVGMSDLLLVEAASPFHEGGLRRTASWVRPRTRPGIRRTDQVGVFFEVYDLPRGTLHYFLRVVLEDLDTGERRPLSFKPVGEIEFRSMWERTRRNPGRIGEYMTLEMDDLKPGSYLLRVEVSAPDQNVTAERSRALDVG